VDPVRHHVGHCAPRRSRGRPIGPRSGPALLRFPASVLLRRPRPVRLPQMIFRLDGHKRPHPRVSSLHYLVHLFLRGGPRSRRDGSSDAKGLRRVQGASERPLPPVARRASSRVVVIDDYRAHPAKGQARSRPAPQYSVIRAVRVKSPPFQPQSLLTRTRDFAPGGSEFRDPPRWATGR